MSVSDAEVTAPQPAPSGAAETGRGARLAAAEAAAEQALRSSRATGLSVAVTGPGGAVSAAAHGLADAAAGRAVSGDTLFEIGSISKAFTCAILLMARDAGLLDLDQPVTSHLPWFTVPSRFPPITIRHLMTHTAGIITGTDFPGDAAFEVWALRDTEACAAPGTWFRYSNVGYKALGLVAEAVYGRPFPDVLGQLLLRPLGMTSTAPAITHDLRDRMAVGYVPRYDDRMPSHADGLVPATWTETATADGSIVSTARDMTAWLGLLLHHGTGPSGDALLSADSVREMLTPATAIDDDPDGASYGLGMVLADVRGHRYAQHSGGMIGYNAAVACDLDEGTGAVALGNGRGPWMEWARHALDLTRAGHAAEPEPALTLPPAWPEAEAPPAEPCPGEWDWIAGHYRCHNPWFSNLRVYWRAGGLRVWCGEDDPAAPDEPLIPLPDGSFRAGSDARSPERMRFDTVINGTATRALYSGCAFYRAFTP